MIDILYMAWPLARAHVGGRRFRWLLWLGLGALLVLAFVLCAHPAHAATVTYPGNGVPGRNGNIPHGSGSFTVFDPIANDANTESQGWFVTILGLVKPTFLILGTIEICWAAAIWAFEKDSLNSLAVEIIKKIMFIGFFYALLQYAPEWIPTIADSFQQAGEQAGNTGPVSTDEIIARGLALVDYIWSLEPHLTITNIFPHLPSLVTAAFVSLGVIICCVIIAAQYFTLKVESYILFAAGAIFLGLGSSSWTKEYVSKYLNYCINVGVRLLVLILCISFMDTAIAHSLDSFTFDVGPLLKMLGICILDCILAQKAPEMAGALMNGGAGLTPGSVMSGAMSTFGGLKNALGTAAGAVGAVAATAARTAQGTGNLGKAVSAGSQLAQQQGKTGAAAKLSGLGMALGRVARELPSSMVNLVKGQSANPMGGRGQNPGPLDRAQQKLQGQLAESGSAASLSGSTGGLSGAGSDRSAAASSKPASGSSSAGGGGGTGGGMTPGIGGGMSGDIAGMETAAKAAEPGLSGGSDLESNTVSSSDTSGSSSNTDGEPTDSLDTASSRPPSYTTSPPDRTSTGTSVAPSYTSSPVDPASASRPTTPGNPLPAPTMAPASRPAKLRKAAPAPPKSADNS